VTGSAPLIRREIRVGGRIRGYSLQISLLAGNSARETSSRQTATAANCRSPHGPLRGTPIHLDPSRDSAGFCASDVAKRNRRGRWGRSRTRTPAEARDQLAPIERMNKDNQWAPRIRPVNVIVAALSERHASRGGNGTTPEDQADHLAGAPRVHCDGSDRRGVRKRLYPRHRREEFDPRAIGVPSIERWHA